MLKRWFRYRVAHGKLIPPEARVDGTAFAEDEYPVVCPKCRYLLRGLADGLCPECGNPFDRGRLLVEQYVLESGASFHAAIARLSHWAFYLVFGVMLVSGLGPWLYTRFFFDPTSPVPGALDIFPTLIRVWLVIGSLCLVVVFVSVVLDIRILLRYRQKARQIVAAIKPVGGHLPAKGDE